MNVSKFVEKVNSLFENKKISSEEKDKLLNMYRYGTPEEKLELERLELDVDFKSKLTNPEFKKDKSPTKKNQNQDKLYRIEKDLESISNKVTFIFWFVIIVIIINLYTTYKYYEFWRELDRIFNTFEI